MSLLNYLLDKTKRILAFSIAIALLSGCHYLPFAKYYTTKKSTGFPKFSKSIHFKGEMNSHRTAYDITKYDWLVTVDHEKQSLNGEMIISFDAMDAEDLILIDLQKRLKIDDIKSTIPIKKWKKKDDLLYVYFEEALITNTKVSISIKYHGKPAIVAKEGPIQWKTDDLGNPWISTQTEGVGAHFMMPCKELLYDEPESCNIRVRVKDDLVVAANGRLDSVSSEPGFNTYHWTVNNPINIYNISFNIGKYEKREIQYNDINGKSQQVELYALEQHVDSALNFYQQTTLHLQKLEELYGIFPWWNDGCKIIETTLGYSAMEHQSAISMGSTLRNDYRPPDTLHVNTTLIHELAHEWWGNSITGMDYCEMWLHEGFATYSEALVIEKIYGKKYYDHYINRFLKPYVSNARSVKKPCGVRYNSWVNHKDADIYNKGALMLHTIRKQLNNDVLFFNTLKQAQVQFAKSNITTEEFIQFFNNEVGKDLSPLFSTYLDFPYPPVLVYQYDSVKGVVNYWWQKKLNADFEYQVKLKGSDQWLIPTTEKQSIKYISEEPPEFDIAEFGYVIVNKASLEI